MNTLFEIVTWPEVQELMTEEGFHENSCLVNEEPFLSEYGSSAYFVRKSWLNSHLQDLHADPSGESQEEWEEFDADYWIEERKSQILE
jgi:hypothetical protein